MACWELVFTYRCVVESVKAAAHVYTPLGGQVAEVNTVQGYATIQRAHRKRVIAVSADIVEGQANTTEVNRALETSILPSMREAFPDVRFSIEGESRALPQPFFVIATQNPLYQIGTFPLPESQLDRFLMRLSLGYPDHDSEKTIFTGGDPRERLPGRHSPRPPLPSRSTTLPSIFWAARAVLQ